MAKKNQDDGGITINELKALIAPRVSARIQLPSMGIYYDKELVPDGYVELTPMSAREEKLIKGLRGNNSDEVIDIILGRCLLTKISFDDLLVTDRLFLLLMLRANSYGEDYGFELTCNKCSKTAKYTVKIPGDFQMKEAMGEEPFNIVLPQSKLKVSFRLMRGKDAKAIEKYIASQEKLGYNTGIGDPGYFYRLARLLVTVENRKIDLVTGMEFIAMLSAMDVEFYKQSIEEVTPGMDTTVTKSCVACGEGIECDLPMSAEFFRPRLLPNKKLNENAANIDEVRGMGL